MQGPKSTTRKSVSHSKPNARTPKIDVARPSCTAHQRYVAKTQQLVASVVLVQEESCKLAVHAVEMAAVTWLQSLEISYPSAQGLLCQHKHIHQLARV